MSSSTYRVTRRESKAQAKRLRAFRGHEARAGVSFTIPALILLVLFIIIPVGLALTLGFTNAKLGSPQPTQWVGLENFQRLLSLGHIELDATQVHELVGEDGDVYSALRQLTRTGSGHSYEGMAILSESIAPDEASGSFWLAGDPLFWKSLKNTMIFALIVVPVQGALALLLAILVNSRFRGRIFFRTVFFLPVIISMVVVSILWVFLLQQHGLVNNALSMFIPGWEPRNFLAEPDTALPAIIFMSIWQAVGFHMIIWLAGLQTIPEELYEAARMDGAGPWRRFTAVTWPGLQNTFVFVLVTITIAALGLFTQVNVITQGGPLDSTTTLVFLSFVQGYGKQQIGYASAISFVFFSIVLAIALIQRWLTREKSA